MPAICLLSLTQVPRKTKIDSVNTSEPLAKSAGFSVAAIPLNFTEAFVRRIFGGSVGYQVSVQWESDSGSIKDLGEIHMSEQVQVLQKTGTLEKDKDQVSGYLPVPANQFIVDNHAVPQSSIKAPGGNIFAYQVEIFRDYRTGATDISVPHSGYMLSYNIRRDNNTGRIFVVRITKKGQPVTANGYASKAGAPIKGIYKTYDAAGNEVDN